MTPTAVTLRRTLGQVMNLTSTVFALPAFLAATAVSFSFALERFEGSQMGLTTVFAISAAVWSPLLAAILAMGVWSDERQSGRMDVLLSSPVRERDLVIGKFLGVLAVLLVSIALAACGCLVPLAFAPVNPLRSISPADVLCGGGILVLQGAFWCATAVAMSVMTRFAFVAACATSALLIAIPRGAWAALQAWAPGGRLSFGEMPLDAHVVDFSSGILSTGVIAFYVILTFFMLFVASKRVAACRLLGGKSVGRRLSVHVTIALAVAFSVSAVVFAVRLDVPIDVSSEGQVKMLSPRTRNLLAETEGEIRIACVIPRNDPRFRLAGRFLRALKQEADSLGGLRIVIQFVDPRWDLGAAERLMRLGANEACLVFEKGRRRTILNLDDDFSERLCLSALRNVSLPPQRRNVYWTFGHGEALFDSYGAYGMSDIARELARDGYINARIDLSGESQVPPDCAMIVVAGARDEFSRAELGRLDSFLKLGGRLLVLFGASEHGGVSSLLPAWGIRASLQPIVGARSLSGSDVIVSEFSGHPISARLKGSQIVLDRPVSFVPSAATDGGAGADRLDYASVAKVGGSTVVAAIERGAGTGRDLALRPTRILAIGDSSFVNNGQLSARANANRDFFLNGVAYLSGVDASAAGGESPGRMMTGMGRSDRLRAAATSAAAIPGAVFLLLLIPVVRKGLKR